jgi:peptidoglycan/xylan/chitin deacetylase (PgdA/CDA1 family)
MPWKNGYTISDEKTLKIVEWPKENQSATVLVIDYSIPSGSEGIGPKEVQTPKAEFSTRTGIYRILDILGKYGLKATFAVPAIMGEVYPESIQAIIKKGHEVAANGLFHEDVSELSKDEEEKRLKLTTETLEKVCGVRPVGWYALPRQMDRYPGGRISPNTVDLLIDADYEYLGNSMADDIPHYWVTDYSSRRNILTLPYYYHFDDRFFLDFPPAGSGTNLENDVSFFENCRQEFDAQYMLGRYFTMIVNPGVISVCGRFELLDNLLSYVQSQPNIWNPTAVECARYWKKKYPQDKYLKLEPSIWKDYPGSLS